MKAGLAEPPASFSPGERRRISLLVDVPGDQLTAADRELLARYEVAADAPHLRLAEAV